MKRFFPLILVLFTLTGCKVHEEDMGRALKFRENLLRQSGYAFTCDLTAEYGQILYQFVLECQVDNKGTVSFTVTAPDSISGIKGELSGAGGQIKFEDSILGFPILSEELPTPLSAPWLFVIAMRSGYIRTCDVQDGKMALTIAETYEEDAMLMKIQFDRNDKPVSCEIIWKGRRLLSMEIDDFHYL